MNIGHHRRKWKSPILGVARIVLRDVFLASIFLAYVDPKLFFSFLSGKILQCSPEPRPMGLWKYGYFSRLEPIPRPRHISHQRLFKIWITQQTIQSQDKWQINFRQLHYTPTGTSPCIDLLCTVSSCRKPWCNILNIQEPHCGQMYSMMHVNVQDLGYHV